MDIGCLTPFCMQQNAMVLKFQKDIAIWWMDHSMNYKA
jgi:hypothetical protein